MGDFVVKKRIQEMPPWERPREKLLAKGAAALSDRELIAVLLGKGTSKIDVMTLADNLLKVFDENSTIPDLKDLCRIDGVGTARGTLILAAFEFSRRRIHSENVRIGLPTDVYPLIRHMADRRREHLLSISLNGANEVIAVRTVSIGLVNRALVHPREVFADPIMDRASAIVVAHNHPSGNLTPSQDDLAVTLQLKKAGQVLGIRLLDHIIFDNRTYYSLMEKGQL
ncbi:MAG: DNA repair protein RadC [Desulfobacteraceae bacterium]|nr:DNA repair protein RadC [Desulfobacteraceae bacterium]